MINLFDLLLAYMIITDSPLFLDMVDYPWGWYVVFILLAAFPVVILKAFVPDAD